MTLDSYREGDDDDDDGDVIAAPFGSLSFSLDDQHYNDAHDDDEGLEE